MSGRGKEKIVLLGMMSKMPVGGVVWQAIHYLEGLRRLGYDPYYVEAHGTTPRSFFEAKDDDRGWSRAADFIAGVMRRFDLDDRWAYHAIHGNGRCYGMTESELKHLYRSAALLINLHGGTIPLPEHVATNRLVYLETDPCHLQADLHRGRQKTIDFLQAHMAYLTFAENYGSADCGLPVFDRFPFRPTRQPVVLDFWAGPVEGPGDAFTTIGNWRQAYRNVKLDGKVYGWSKRREFLRFLELPRRTGPAFELALSNYGEKDGEMLERHGWSVRPALDFSSDPDSYRSYIRASYGEFTVAKDANVRLRTGWFSDRSATYLAAGRPVITQDTGFGSRLPTGQGLLPFSTLDEAVEEVGRVVADHSRHAGAARRLAREYFSHDVVLPPILSELGIRRPGALRHVRVADGRKPEAHGEPAASPPRPGAGVVCVVGMHRSGTSAFARLVNLLGVYLGPSPRMLRPNPENPEGYWEHKLIMKLNERLLARFGGSWFKPPPLEEGWAETATATELAPVARRIIDEDFAGRRLWGWKDPRTCLTLPFWQRLIGEMRYIICLRNPLDVAASLSSRHGPHPSLQDGLALWLRYVRASLEHSAGRQRLLLFYEDLMGDWRTEMDRVAAFLGTPPLTALPGRAEEAQRFLRQGLWHHRAVSGEVLDSSLVPGPVKELFVTLRLAVGSAAITEGDRDALYRLAQRTDI